MDLKSFAKKFKIVRKLRDIVKSRDFKEDKKFFLKNYMYSENITKEKLEYELILEIHKLEKGFACQNPRPFGIEKIKRIIEILEIHKNRKYPRNFATNLALSTLKEYKNFYEKMKWVDREEYSTVKNYLADNSEFTHIQAGAFDITKEELLNGSQIDYESFLKSRHSVRNFAAKKLKKEDIKKAVEMAILTPSACNRQMCKIYYMESQNSKKIIEKYAQGLGLVELDNINYFLITFDISANYFIGERNQGWFNAGLMTMNFVNALHSLGIGSCCIQFGNTFQEEKDMKKLLDLPESERIAIIVACGYYSDNSRIPYSTRKPLEDIFSKR